MKANTKKKKSNLNSNKKKKKFDQISSNKSTNEYLSKLRRESLGVGHLKSKEKDDKLKELFNYKKK